MDNKVQETIGDVQHVEMKSVLTFQPIKRLGSTTVESAHLLLRYEFCFQEPKTYNYFV